MGANKINDIFNPKCDYFENARITKTYFDYYFHDVSTEAIHEKFVTFCERFIIEEMGIQVERIKEDEEDNPRAKSMSLFYGTDTDGSTIAFRICTRHNWQKQFENDMSNFSEYDEGSFSQLYFITNQDIVPKIIFNKEIKYLNSSKMKAHLIDRKWIINTIFEQERYMKLACEVFGLSSELAYTDEIVTYKKKDVYKEEFEKIDELFEDYLSKIEDKNESTVVPPNQGEGATNEKVSSPLVVEWAKVDEALRNAFEMLDKLYPFSDDADKITEQYKYLEIYKRILVASKEKEKYAQFVYDSVWKFVFDEFDERTFYKYAMELGDILVDTDDPVIFEKCVLIWILLRKYGVDSKRNRALLDKIESVYESFTKTDYDEVDKLQVSHAYSFLQMYIKDEKEISLDNYYKVLIRANGNKKIDIVKFAILFMEDKNYYTAKFEQIETGLDNFVAVLKDFEVAPSNVGKVWFKQALDVGKSRAFESMTYLNKSLMSFEQEEGTEYLQAKAIYKLGQLYEKRNLRWLARTTYMKGMTLCIKLYEENAISSKLFRDYAIALKNIELLLGHVMYSTRFNYLETIIREINNDEVDKLEKSQDTYDFMMAVLIYKTPLIKLEQIGRVSRYFERNGLYYSNIAVKHELGHYDKKLLSALDNNKKVFDEYVSKWKQQPIKENIDNVEPWYGVEYKAHFKLKVMNCKIEVNIENKAITLEYGAMLCAALESVLYEATETDTQIGNLKVYVLYDKTKEYNIDVSSTEELDTKYVVKIGRFSSQNISEEIDIVKSHLNEFVNLLIRTIFRYKTSYNKMKGLLDSLEHKGRVDILTEAFVNSLEVFGYTTFDYNALTVGYDNILSKRSIDDVFPNQNLSKKIACLKKRLLATFEQSDTIKEKIMNNVISVPIWEKAHWETVMIPNKAGALPVFALVFENIQQGKAIFNTWIERYGSIDKINYIGIRVLKKIDAKEPFKYRVIIGNTRKVYDDDNNEIETPVYTCTVSAENVAKLYTFEKLLKNKTDFILCPAYKDEEGKIVYDTEHQILKKHNGIRVCNAWEIDLKDYLSVEGIFSTDIPVIPNGADGVELIKLIEEKKRRVEILNAALDMTE